MAILTVAWLAISSMLLVQNARSECNYGDGNRDYLFPADRKEPCKALMGYFDNSLLGIVSAFVLLTGENYSAVTLALFNIPGHAFVFFIVAVWTLISYFVLLALVLAIIFNAYKDAKRSTLVHQSDSLDGCLIDAFEIVANPQTWTIGFDVYAKFLQCLQVLTCCTHTFLSIALAQSCSDTHMHMHFKLHTSFSFSRALFYAHIHTHARTRARTRTHTHTHTLTYTHANTHARTHTHAHTNNFFAYPSCFIDDASLYQTKLWLYDHFICDLLTLQPGIDSKTVRLYWKNHSKVKVRTTHARIYEYDDACMCASVMFIYVCICIYSLIPTQVEGRVGIDVNEFIELGVVF
jgi:hypothetical protein